MIIPRPQLILLALLIVVPALGLALSVAQAFIPALLALAAFLAAAGYDAMQGLRRRDQVTIRLPERLRWVQGRISGVDIICETLLPLNISLRLGLAVPPELEPEREDITVELPAQAGRHLFSFRCTAMRRGLFTVAGCYFEVNSPLNLWDIRGSQRQPIEVRAYPNLDAERKQAAALFLRTNQIGMQAQRQVGQGRDFEKLREYVPGDSFSTIHWKATARRNRPITKIFQVEKTQEVYVMVDASRLSGRLQFPGEPTKGNHLDRYIAATLLLGLAAEKQGDLFGLLTFSDRVHGFVRARNGKEHYSSCRESLYQLEPRPVSPDFEEVATFIRLRLRRRALIIFMTDLDDPILMEAFQRSIDLICRKHLVIVQMLQTGEVRPLFSNPQLTQVDELYQDLANHLTWHELQQVTGQLKQHGVSLSLLSNERFSTDTVSSYLRIKQRQTPMILNLQDFIRAEKPYWEELEALLRQIESDPGNRLDLVRIRRLHYLYDRAASDLLRISTFASSPEIIGYLESLVAQAYGEIHESRGGSGRFRFWTWLTVRLPQTFRKHLNAFACSVLLTILGSAFGAYALAEYPDAKDVLLPFSHLQGKPSERVAREEHSKGRYLTGEKASFAGSLMTHNIRVSLFTLAMGMTYGVGTVVVLFYNGVILGAVSYDYIADGQGRFLLGWLLPHGSIEIPSVLIAGQAGFVLAGALIGSRQRLSFWGRLVAVRDDLVTLMGGFSLMLVWAGMIEAFFSQYHEPVIPYSFKIGFGLIELVLLTSFYAFSGRKAKSSSTPNL